MLNKDILVYIYNGLTRYDHVLIAKIRQTCKMFSYYPPNVLDVEHNKYGTYYLLLVNDRAIRHRSQGTNPLTDGPAVEWKDGDKEWYLFGKRHRSQGMNPLTDGPAVERVNGCKEWWMYDKRHREDGPAVERPGGERHWYLHGKRHRSQGMNPLTDGPAIELANGHKEWYLHGQLHREDGPAVEFADGGKMWFRNNERYFEPALTDSV